MITASDRRERSKRRMELQDRLIETVLSPNMVRLAMVAAIVAYATTEARSDSNVGPVRSALAFALPGIGIPLIAADAGITDYRALGAISAASVGYVTGQMGVGWLEAMTGGTVNLPTLPKINLPNPIEWWKNIGGPGWAPWS